jgi:hypothetical protein
MPAPSPPADRGLHEGGFELIEGRIHRCSQRPPLLLEPLLFVWGFYHPFHREYRFAVGDRLISRPF